MEDEGLWRMVGESELPGTQPDRGLCGLMVGAWRGLVWWIPRTGALTPLDLNFLVFPSGSFSAAHGCSLLSIPAEYVCPTDRTPPILNPYPPGSFSLSDLGHTAIS